MKKTHSIISVFLCLFLLFFVVSSPLCVEVHASSLMWDYLLRSIAGSLLFSGSSKIAEMTPSVLNSVSAAIGDLISPAYQQHVESQRLIFEATGIPQFQLDRTYIDEIYTLMTHEVVKTAAAFSDSDVVAVQGKLAAMEDVDLIYLPTAEVLQRPSLITRDQLLTGNFADSLAWNNVLLYDIKSAIGVLSTEIFTLTEKVKLLQTETSNIYKRVHNGLNDLRYQLSDLHGITHSDLTLIRSNLSNLHSMLHTDLTNIRTNLSDMYRMLSDKLSSFPAVEQKLESISTVFPALNQRLDTIIEKIPAYVEDTVVVQKPAIDVQIGTETLVVSDYATMSQAFSAKMGWVPQIFDFLSELRDRLYQSTAPKVKLHLSDAEGPYNWGDEAYILDMSWYAPYKASVDTILSGIMWLCFGWAVYKRIPDIISGVGLTVENATESRGHVWSDRAEREASFSYRQERREDYYIRKWSKEID